MQAIAGILLMVAALSATRYLHVPVTVTTTDASGRETEQLRARTIWEWFRLVGGCCMLAAAGLFLLAGTLSRFDRHVPDEGVLRTLLALAILGLLMRLAVHAWSASRQGFAGDPVDTSLEVDPDDSVEDVVLRWVWLRMLDHPVTAALAAAVFFGLALLVASRLPAIWSGDLPRWEEVQPWLQPLSFLGGLVGLSEAAVGLICLVTWMVLGLLYTNNSAGVLVSMALFIAYWVVALVAWPLGFMDHWFDLGRSLLSFF